MASYRAAISAGDDARWSRRRLQAREAVEFFCIARWVPEWVRGNAPLVARHAGHSAFVKTDGTVFAHIHPMGTASMTAVNLAETGNARPEAMDMPGVDMSSMPGMTMSAAHLPNEVSFP